MTNAEKFTAYRPLTPLEVSDKALKTRIERGYSKAKCIRPSVTASMAGRAGGKARKRDWQIKLPGSLS